VILLFGFEEQVKRYDLKNILVFVQEMGILIKKLYDELKSDIPSVYFFNIAYRSDFVPGFENEQDIEYVREMKF